MKLRRIRRRARTNYISIHGLQLLRGFAVPPCKTYEPECPVCDYWAFFRANGRFPRDEEI